MNHPLPHSNRVIVLPVTLKGRIEIQARFILDTGATYVMIPWKFAEALDLKAEVSQKRLAITTDSGTEIVPLVTIPSLTVLDKQLENVEAVIHDLPPQANVDGLLGLSFLKSFRLTLNFPEKSIELQ